MNKQTIKKVLILMAFAVIAIIMGNSKAYAASASMTALPKTIEPGEKVTIKASISDTETWNLSLSANGGKLSGTTSATDATGGEEVSKNVINATFTADKEGSYTITLSGTVAGNDLVKKEISVPVTVKVEKEEPKLSTDATLQNLGITPSKYDFSGFKSGTTSYSVKVPNEVETISIYATAKDSNATISGTGSKTLKEGKNTFSIKVTAEDKKTTETYKLTVTRAKASEEEEEPSTDATLKNLGITPREYDFSGFKPETTSYSLEVPNDVEKISIYAYAKDAKASVTGAGTKTLEEGENTFSVKVTAEDKKTTNTYKLVITRAEKTEEEPEKPEEEPEKPEENPTVEVTGLTSLQIAGYTLNPEFTPEVYEYTLDITDMIESLDIRTSTSDKNTTVEIVGNGDFKEGENVITILVNNSKEDKTDTYQVIVNIKEDSNVVVGATEIDNTIQKGQEEYNKQRNIVKIVIIVVIVLLIIFLIARNKIRKDMKLEDELEEENRSRLNLNEEDEFFERINNRDDEMPRAIARSTSEKTNSNVSVNRQTSSRAEELKRELSPRTDDFNGEPISKNEESFRESDSGVEELRKIRRSVREDNELDDFEKMDNLEEILRARKNRGSNF